MLCKSSTHKHQTMPGNVLLRKDDDLEPGWREPHRRADVAETYTYEWPGPYYSPWTIHW